jgi:hypothetical protein
VGLLFGREALIKFDCNFTIGFLSLKKCTLSDVSQGDPLSVIKSRFIQTNQSIEFTLWNPHPPTLGGMSIDSPGAIIGMGNSQEDLFPQAGLDLEYCCCQGSPSPENNGKSAKKITH